MATIRARRLAGLIAVALTALVCLSATNAEEIKGRWRVELQIGGLDPGDSILSDADRGMTVLLNSGRETFFPDPRPNSLATEEARQSADTRFDLRLGYGIASWKSSELYLDVGLGYYTTFLEDIEVAYSLDRNDGNYYDRFGQRELYQRFGDAVGFQNDSTFVEDWDGQRVDGGRFRMLPVSANLLLRFRPTKRMNPYIGGGIGYYFVDFTPSDEWTALANQLDASCVSYAVQNGPSFRNRKLEHDPARVTNGIPGSWDYYNGTAPSNFFDGDPCKRVALSSLVPVTGLVNPDTGLEEPHPNAGLVVPVEWQDFGRDLIRPQIETPNSLFLEIRAGTEWQWRPKTAFFADVRFNWAQEAIRVTVDGREKFGKGVPSGRWEEDQVPIVAGGEVAYVSVGGLVLPAGPTDQITGQKTIQAQPGEYFVNGGTVDYGGWNFSIGVRFTL